MKPTFLAAGCGILAVTWLGPLPELAREAFFAHMSMHMAVVAVAAPLLALGLRGGRLDPIPRAPGVFNPISASLLELVIVWTWHAPALHQLARHSAPGLVVEQAMFLLAGLAMWMSALGRSSRDSGDRAAAGVLGLLLTAMHMTLLGALLALTPRPLYPHLEGLSYLSPLEDQHLGGAIMLVVGGLSYLLGGLGLTGSLLRRKAGT